MKKLLNILTFIMSFVVIIDYAYVLLQGYNFFFLFVINLTPLILWPIIMVLSIIFIRRDYTRKAYKIFGYITAGINFIIIIFELNFALRNKSIYLYVGAVLLIIYNIILIYNINYNKYK